MKKLVEYIGGTVIVVVLFLTIFAVSTNQRQNQASATGGALSVHRPAALLSPLEDDLASLRLGSGEDRLLRVDEHAFVVLRNFGLGKSPDTIRYYCGDHRSLVGTPNPRDFVLLRQVNSGKAQELAVGLVSLRFSFLNEAFSKTGNLDAVRFIRLDFETESAFPVGGSYKTMASQLNINCQ